MKVLRARSSSRAVLRLFVCATGKILLLEREIRGLAQITLLIEAGA